MKRASLASVRRFVQRSSISSSSFSFSSFKMTTSSTTKDWNVIVGDAERVVGYPTSYLSLRCLLSDEISNLAAHVRKLVGSGHPLLKTAKRLIYNGKNYMHTRGLIVLLMSKCAGHHNQDQYQYSNRGQQLNDVNDPITDGISYRQRCIAEVAEMIHMAHQIHRGVVNASSWLFPDENVMQDMEFGNKIAVLCGDYLLGNVAKILSSLRDANVVEILTTATRNFTQAEFICENDIHGNSVSKSGMKLNDWVEKTYLLTGSLLALSCQATLNLAKHPESLQKEGFLFGKNVALAWQVYSDLQPFIDPEKNPPGKPFDLTSLPVVLHLQEDKDLLHYINEHKKNLDNVDYKLVREAIFSGSAVQESKELCKKFSDDSLKNLDAFHMNDANIALRNIVKAISNQIPLEEKIV